MTISSISSTITTGVTLDSGSYGTELLITNSGAVVSNSGSNAVDVPAGLLGVSIINEGELISQANSLGVGGEGVYDPAGGYIQNDGSLTGSVVGVYVSDGGSIVNHGAVSSEGTGILLLSDSTLTNTGVISSSEFGVVLNNSTVINEGSIVGAIDAVVFSHGTNVLYNLSMISGKSVGVNLPAGGTLVDDGYIGGTTAAIEAAGAFDLVLNAQSQLHGAVIAGGDATLDLTGTASGSIDVGSSLSGFAQIEFDTNSSWTVEGNIAALASGELITGMTYGDTLILDGFSASYGQFVPGTGLVISNATASETIEIEGTFSSGNCSIADNTNGGSIIQVPCFLKGTRITTACGDVNVEELKVGTAVKTMHQGWAPIKWIGRRTFYAGHCYPQKHLQPICIRENALFDGIPSRDLLISGDHSICEGGVLIAAWRLQNGVSITRAEIIGDIEYFHVELERHDVIFAENCPVETFLDLDCRDRFSNWPEYRNGYRDSSVSPSACLPRLTGGFYLDIIQQRIAERAGVPRLPKPIGPMRGQIDEMSPGIIRGWAQDEAAPEDPVLIDLYYGNRQIASVLANEYREDLEAANLGSGCHAFEIRLNKSLRGQFLRLERRLDGAVLGGLEQLGGGSVPSLIGNAA